MGGAEVLVFGFEEARELLVADGLFGDGGFEVVDCDGVGF